MEPITPSTPDPDPSPDGGGPSPAGDGGAPWLAIDRRPPGVDDATVEAVGKLSEAIEWVERPGPALRLPPAVRTGRPARR
ncbi:MAG: hypothetical protein R2749_07200 [Acidimicrobiales bacterium]